MDNKTIIVNNKKFIRIPIKTRILNKNDDIVDIVREYAIHKMQKDDILVISESPLAITQGRAIPESEIKIGWVANLLWRFVTNNPSGIGLRSPSSMQCAVEEVGAIRILFAAFIGAITKFFGRSGDFYRIAGKQAALIDAASTSPVPPYNKTVIKGPKNPGLVAHNLHQELGFHFAIMDINDIGGSWVIGNSDAVDIKELELIMKDNPQGQADELTPLCIVRKVDE